jgi:uncharacterized protein YndB with AHSA1/START domain
VIDAPRSIRVSRIIGTDAETLFRAWTDPRVLMHWWRRFFSMITEVEVKELIVDGDTACALTRYELQPPSGPAFASDVAEVFRVQANKIASFGIYFDSAPFPK